MVFTAPAVQYSALATMPLGSKSHHSISHTASVRFKLSRAFKRLFVGDGHNEQRITTEIVEHIELPKTTLHLTETTVKRQDDDDDLTIVKSPNNNNSGNQTCAVQDTSKVISQPTERLPFTGPYFSMSTESSSKYPFELSSYHKHCIHQQKYVDQKQYQDSLLHKKNGQQTPLSRPNPFQQLPPSSAKEHRSDLSTSRLQNLIENAAQQRQVKFIDEQSDSNPTTKLSVSPSADSRIGLGQNFRRKVSNSAIRLSHPQQPSHRLRRLHSKSKVRLVANDTKADFFSSPSMGEQKKTFATPPVSSSIAYRIEMLKQAMRTDHTNNQVEFRTWKSEKSPSTSTTLTPLSPPAIDMTNRETQTIEKHSSPSEIHHIHHHHLHPSSIDLSLSDTINNERCHRLRSCFSWRIYLSIGGTLCAIVILFLALLIELSTIFHNKS